jgi:hypothetical protein
MTRLTEPQPNRPQQAVPGRAATSPSRTQCIPLRVLEDATVPTTREVFIA